MDHQMSEVWFSDPNMFGVLYGSIAGGVGGGLFGCLCAAAGVLASRGKGKGFINAVMCVSILYGIGNLVAGILAVIQKQPYEIFYPFLMIGILFSVLSIPLHFVFRHRYAQAERQRLEAEEFRKT